MLFFFYESQALHRQLCSGICYFLVTLLVLHMLFFVFLHPIMLFFWGSNLKKCLQQAITPYFIVVSGVHSSAVFNACVYNTKYAWMQSTLSVCIQQYDPETYLDVANVKFFSVVFITTFFLAHVHLHVRARACIETRHPMTVCYTCCLVLLWCVLLWCVLLWCVLLWCVLLSSCPAGCWSRRHCCTAVCCVCVCACVCLFIKLHITAQSGPVIYSFYATVCNPSGGYLS